MKHRSMGKKIENFCWNYRKSLRLSGNFKSLVDSDFMLEVHPGDAIELCRRKKKKKRKKRKERY